MGLVYKDSQTIKCHLQKWPVVMLQQLSFTKKCICIGWVNFQHSALCVWNKKWPLACCTIKATKNYLKKVEIPVTVLTPSLEQPLCLPLHDFPDSEFDGLSHVKVLTETVGALAHTFLNFVHVQCFCLDCKLSAPLPPPAPPPPPTLCVCVCDVLVICPKKRKKKDTL